jgi:hypothetical protein
MSTTWLENQSFPWIFMEWPLRTRHLGEWDALPTFQPYLRMTRFQGCLPLATKMLLIVTEMSRQKEKRTLPRAMATVSRFNYVTISYPNPGSGILTLIPFRHKSVTWDRPAMNVATHHRPDYTVHEVNLCLRIDWLAIKCCSRETFLHFGLQKSHLNICYYHQDLH